MISIEKTNVKKREPQNYSLTGRKIRKILNTDKVPNNKYEKAYSLAPVSKTSPLKFPRHFPISR